MFCEFFEMLILTICSLCQQQRWQNLFSLFGHLSKKTHLRWVVVAHNFTLEAEARGSL